MMQGEMGGILICVMLCSPDLEGTYERAKQPTENDFTS